jgi:Bacterial regulatory helix-turn-helix proteins, AraC family
MAPEHRRAPPPYGEQHVPPIKGIFESGVLNPTFGDGAAPKREPASSADREGQARGGTRVAYRDSLDCQFSSQSSFTRAFRKASGMTPAQYQRALR